MSEPVKVEIHFPVPDEGPISDGLRVLTEAIHRAGKADGERGGLFGGEWGYGANFENDVFLMHRYCWCEEDSCLWCGGSGCQTRPPEPVHGEACYQTELHNRMERYEIESGYRAADEAAFGSRAGGPLLSGFNWEQSSPAPGVTVSTGAPRKDEAMERWRAAYDKKRKFEDRLYDELCKKHGMDRKLGAAIHCTCGANDEYRRAFDACQCDWHAGRGIFRFGPAADAPHFWHKASGTQVRWYKYIGRGMDITLKAQWPDVLSECLRSVSK